MSRSFLVAGFSFALALAALVAPQAASAQHVGRCGSCGTIQDIDDIVYDADKGVQGAVAGTIIGVNTFRNPHVDVEAQMDERELRRGTDEEKQNQLTRLRAFQDKHKAEAPVALKKLTDAALTGGNTFDALMEAVRVCSMGQITKALFEVGGEYRRNT